MAYGTFYCVPPGAAPLSDRSRASLSSRAPSHSWPVLLLAPPYSWPSPVVSRAIISATRMIAP